MVLTKNQIIIGVGVAVFVAVIIVLSQSKKSAKPAITTNPPSVTTNPPSVTTNPPSVTTNPPSVTTNPPSVTTNPPKCDVNKCNQIMKEFVDRNLQFIDTAKTFPECANCPSRWFKGVEGISYDGKYFEPMLVVYDENLGTYVPNPQIYNKVKL